MFTSFPDFPRSSSPPVQAVDDSHRRRRTAGIVLNERGEPVLHWPDVIPDGWSVSRRITAMDAAGMLDSAAGGSGRRSAVPRGCFSGAAEGSAARSATWSRPTLRMPPTLSARGQALRLCEVTIRECLNIADLAEKGGSVPWDAGVADPGLLAQAARAAADYLRGFSDSALRMMGTSPAASSNGVGAAGDRAVGDGASVSDRQTAAYDAHRAMKASYGDALRSAASAPAVSSASAWGGGSSFGGAAVSDEDRAASAHAEMKRSISDAWRSGR